ncbi:MAG: nucleotidyltransferase domain-containing protein [Anaerolineae bacterium]
MPDVFAAAKLFVDLVRREAPDDVALIVYYGSYALGSATPHSDLDLYYIPDAGKGGALYRSIVYQGCPFEFWGVSWDFAERIAAGKHRWCVAPSIIANAKVLYARAPADEERFTALQANIAHLQQPASKGQMLKLAQETFQNSAAPLYRLTLAEAQQDSTGVRWAAAQLVDVLLDCLALVNQTFFSKNWASNIAQLEQLSLRPEGLRERIMTLLTEAQLSHVVGTAQRLAADTRAIILSQTRTLNETASASGVFNGYYPAIREYVNKILSACARDNWANASVVAAQMQKEMAMMLAYAEDGIPYSEFSVFAEYRGAFDRLGFPDLSPAVDGHDLAQLAALTQRFEAAAQAYLQQQGVTLNVAETWDSLKALIG